ncbi:MAG: AMP-binding protein [Deltaproteobacteria bacterium]|jgi:acetyl-CoA synthetase|nr:AMP-binding protein [Deltaproteobacteria bacterium]
MAMTAMAPEEAVQSWLKEYGGSGVSAAYFLCDRHASIPEKIALFYEDKQGRSLKFTFRELRELSAKMAGFLQSIGIKKGDRVAALLPKTPELLITALAVWRLGAVYVPLFTAFGPDAIELRAGDSGASAVVTNAAHRPKLNDAPSCVGGNIRVITVADALGKGIEEGDYSFWNELEKANPLEKPTPVTGDDMMIMLYTSGTTGSPKGVEVPVKALAAFQAYMEFGLDIREDDMFWNMADPGWAYGLYYNAMGPLLVGKATLFFNAPFNATDVFRILSQYRVTNFASAPTAYRALKAEGDKAAAQFPLYLRVASSAGEPLNPEVIEWSRKVLGVPIHDHYGQTELGMVANNHHRADLKRPLKMGSLGQSMPGFRMTVVSEEGRELEAGVDGIFAADVENSPLFWFRGYWNDEARTKERFLCSGRYYLAGDTVSMDGDGYFYFSGRSDDIILCAGYRIGPFEVESALIKHPAVAEAAVVGKADELRLQIVKAYVALKPGTAPSEELAEELKAFVKTHLAAHQYPREIEFVEQLPKTPSGKIQRFLLRKDA